MDLVSTRPTRADRMTTSAAQRQRAPDLYEERRIRILEWFPLGSQMLLDLPQRFAGDVVTPTALTTSLEHAELGSVDEVPGRSALVQLGELHVRRPGDPQPEESVEQGSAHSLVELVSSEQLVDPSPLRLGLIEAPAHRLGLHVVGPQVELHPERRVVARLPRSTAGRREHVVVVLRVVAQPFLDAGEGRLDDLVLGQHHRLQGARHPPVAVAERVDHHKIEVRHRSAHEWVVAVRRSERIGQRAHESRDRLPVGTLVDIDAATVVADVDLLRAVATGRLGQVVVQQHEVH